MPAPEMDHEALAESPFTAAIRGMRREIDRLIEEQKGLLAKASVGWAPEPTPSRSPHAGPPIAPAASPPPPGARGRGARPPAPEHSPSVAGPSQADPGASLDMTKRLEDLSRALGQRLRPTLTSTDDPSPRAEG